MDELRRSNDGWMDGCLEVKKNDWMGEEQQAINHKVALH